MLSKNSSLASSSSVPTFPTPISSARRNFNSQMGKEVAIFVLPFLLASTLYPDTTLAQTKTFLVGGPIGWTKENNGSWFPIGTIFHDGDSLEFVFNQTNYNVVVVDKNAYEACKAPEGALEYNSGDDTVPLKKGENYFICTKRGCCENNATMMVVAAAGQRQTEKEETGIYQVINK